MLTSKLLAALGIAGALLIGATADASANPWHGPIGRPVLRGAVYRAPVYSTPVFVPRAPIVYSAPTYAPAYPAPVGYGATYAPVVRPFYGNFGWRHPFVRGFGRRW